MSRQQTKEHILAYKNIVMAQVERTCAIAKQGTENDMIDCIHRYVCGKFYLDPETTDTARTLFALAGDSIEAAITLKVPIAKDSEMATTCGAAGTAGVKVALLFLAVKKDFGIDVETSEIAFLKNTDELGRFVYRALQHKQQTMALEK